MGFWDKLQRCQAFWWILLELRKKRRLKNKFGGFWIYWFWKFTGLDFFLFSENYCFSVFSVFLFFCLSSNEFIFSSFTSIYTGSDKFPTSLVSLTSLTSLATWLRLGGWDWLIHWTNKPRATADILAHRLDPVKENLLRKWTNLRSILSDWPRIASMPAYGCGQTPWHGANERRPYAQIFSSIWRSC